MKKNIAKPKNSKKFGMQRPIKENKLQTKNMSSTFVTLFTCLALWRP